MQRMKLLAGMFGLLFALGAAAQEASSNNAALSPAEQAIITRQIGTLKSATDRQVAQGWSDAKKVAEMICRPAALSTLKKDNKGVDKVFLGTDSPESLTLATIGRLMGRGQFRSSKGWQDFTFTCEINPKNAKVTGFQWTPTTAQPDERPDHSD